MKTKRCASLPGSLLTFLMAALFLLTFLGCEKDAPDIEEIPTEYQFSKHLKSPTFKVYPEGTKVSLFEGSLELEFPEGAVAAPTLFVIYSFQANDLNLDNKNMFNLGFYLEGDSPDQKLNDVTVRVNYDLDPANWKKSAPGPADENLTIYHVSPDIYNYQAITSIGSCCVDCSCTMIKGSIQSCGYYVLGKR